MISSETQLCNIALSLIGSQQITNIDDGTVLATLCRTHYDVIKDEVLREEKWTCAIERQTLAVPSEENLTSYDYGYQLPTDPLCIRVLNIVGREYADYIIEGRNLFTDVSPVTIRYVKDLESPALMDAMLGKAMVFKLAASIALSVSDNSRKAMEMEAMYRAQLLRAKEINSIEGSGTEEPPELWTEAGRYG